MAQFDYGLDILKVVARRAGEILPTTTDVTNADRLIDTKLYINSAYWEICALKPWRWARKRAQFVSTASNTGSATVSGATVTLSATIAASQAGYKFFFDSDGIPHRISAHTGGTATVTLATTYTGETTSGTFTIFNDEITVASDILDYPIVTQLDFMGDIRLVPEAELAQRFPRNIYGTVRAQYGAFISDSVLRICPWTTDAQLFECSYNYRPDPLDFTGAGSGDTPIIPRDSRIIIALRALEKIYSDKRDVRLAVIKQETSEVLAKMSSVESTFTKPRIWVPRGFRTAG